MDKMLDILENSIRVNKPRHCGQNGEYSRNSIQVNKPRHFGQNGGYSRK